MPSIKARHNTAAYLRLTELLHKWRTSHFGEPTFVAVLAAVIGILVGLMAVLLKFLIKVISDWATGMANIAGVNWLYLVLPAVGILLCSLYVNTLVRDNISHGVTRVLYAIAKKKSHLHFRHTYASIIASSLTIGFGGSVGAEGPMAFTGAAIGSNLGRLFKLSPQMLMLMVGCGAAAGIAGIFKAPIAGVLFAVEVLMLDLTAGRTMPLIISSVCGATMAYVFTGYNEEFFFTQSEPFFASRIPWVVLLGVFCGFVSLYFCNITDRVESLFKRLDTPIRRYLVGIPVLSLLIFMFPPLYGEGYESITALINGNADTIMAHSAFAPLADSAWGILAVVALLCLFKGVATAATNGAGGVGGTFAPSLYVGCMAGFLFAGLINASGMIDPQMPLSVKNFTLLGMAGLLAGVMHAPLMAIFLAAEMTGGYELFLPLLIVSAASYGTARLFTPFGIYSRRLAKRGQLLTHHMDRNVLTLLKMGPIVETDFMAVTPDMRLKDMVKVIAQSNRNLFPVVDGENRLKGIVQLDDIRNIMFRTDLYRVLTVDRFMATPPALLIIDTPMEQVMATFDKTNAWNLPVVDKDGHYVGFVSKSKIFNSYREVLQSYSND